jgi:hypothetical protein
MVLGVISICRIPRKDQEYHLEMHWREVDQLFLGWDIAMCLSMCSPNPRVGTNNERV